MISQKQLETIEHLKIAGISTSEAVIEWCKAKMLLPARHHRPNTKSLVGRRKYGRPYYQGIIDYLSEEVKKGKE